MEHYQLNEEYSFDMDMEDGLPNLTFQGWTNKVPDCMSSQFKMLVCMT